MKYAYLAVAALAFVPGCVVHVRELRPQRHVTVVEEAHEAPSGAVWVVETRHVHSDHCGHYWYNGQWYQVRGHVHGAGCGHIYHDGHWVLAAASSRDCAHDDRCGHYHHNGRWYFMRGHVHRKGCGHEWNGRMWITVRF